MTWKVVWLGARRAWAADTFPTRSMALSCARHVLRGEDLVDIEVRNGGPGCVRLWVQGERVTRACVVVREAMDA